MAKILITSETGCWVFTDTGENSVELENRKVTALCHDIDDACVAVVDGIEIWRRTSHGHWSHVTTTAVPLQTITSVKGAIFGGTMGDASLVRIHPNGEAERLTGFDEIQGRNDWIASGPPVHVRSLTSTADNSAILAAVHVGGIPRSTDNGKSWTPTIPIMHDVHQVIAHATLPNIVAAAAAVGLCVSKDSGKTWTVLSDGLAQPSYCLAIAFLQDEVLFSHEDGPFAKRSQIWRWPIEGGRLEQVRNGLPEWLEGKVDTNRISTKNGHAALLDHGGNLWFSQTQSQNWKRIATGANYYWGGILLL